MRTATRTPRHSSKSGLLVFFSEPVHSRGTDSKRKLTFNSRACPFLDAPIVSLSLGQPLDSNKLMNGSDVYLECDVKANPPIKKVEWFHSVRSRLLSFCARIPNLIISRTSNYTPRAASSSRTRRSCCRASQRHRTASTCAGLRTSRAPCPATTFMWM